MRQSFTLRAALLVTLATLFFATRAAAQENGSAPPPADPIAPAEPAVVAPSGETEPLLVIVDLREPVADEENVEHAVAPEPEAAPESRSEDGLVFSIGLSGLLSGVQVRDEIEVNALTGVDLGFRVAPWLYVGARRIGV